MMTSQVWESQESMSTT